MTGYDQCYVHAPEIAETRKRNNSRAGKKGGRGRPVVELSGLKRRFEKLADGVLNGDIDRSDAAVAGQLLNYAVRSVAVVLKAKEVEELEVRLGELEALLAQRNERQWG